MATSLLLLAMLSAPYARAQPVSASAVPASEAPAPELVSLEASLKRTQDARAAGRVDEKGYREFVTRFRRALDAAMLKVAPTPVNAALHARILSRLGDSEQAEAALGTALKRDPEDPALRVALSQVRYDKKDYAGALAEADAVLARDPSNKAAIALKHFSEGRVEAGPSSGASSPPAARPPPAAVSPGLQALLGAGADARRSGDRATELRLAQEAMRLEPASPAAQEFYRSVAKDLPGARGVNDSLVRGLAAAEVSNPPHGPSPVPFAPLGAAGAVCGVGAWALFCRKSDDPRLRGPLTALLMTGVGATGTALVGGAYHMMRATVATDVGMFHTGQPPLLQRGPRAESSPGQPNDCTDQLKKFYPLQQDAQHKRQVALAALHPILDRYGLTFDKFQSVFGKLKQSFVASCDADADACQLLANKEDWTAAQATYGQIQVLDQKLQVLSNALAKVMDRCNVVGNDAGDNKKRKADSASKRDGDVGLNQAHDAPRTASLIGADKAIIDPRKLLEYSLNPDHRVGGNKARVFQSVLGFTRENAEDLVAQIRHGLVSEGSSPIPGTVDQYGSRFSVDILVVGPAGRGVVRTAWIYKPGSTIPELITLYVK